MISPFAPSNLERMDLQRLLLLQANVEKAIAKRACQVGREDVVGESIDLTPEKRRKPNPSGSQLREILCRWCAGERPETKLHWASGYGEPWHFCRPRGIKREREALAGAGGMHSVGAICEPCAWAKRDLNLGEVDKMSEIEKSNAMDAIKDNRAGWPRWCDIDSCKRTVLDGEAQRRFECLKS